MTSEYIAQSWHKDTKAIQGAFAVRKIIVIFMERDTNALTPKQDT